MAALAQTPVCLTGFVMDTFCINRGSLLDSGLVSLDNPHRHTIHCLIDVPQCRESGYEMLGPATGSTGCDVDPAACTPYERLLVLDATGNQLVLEEAARVGHPDLGCTDCCTTCGGTQREGFRATVVGTYNLDDPLPRPVAVTAVHNFAVSCESLNVSVASAEGEVSDAGGGLRSLFQAHGSCMLVGWGFLLPMGVTIAMTMRHREPLWFKLHRACNVLGLTFATVGFIIALLNFNIIGEASATLPASHAYMGLIVMILGLQQPFNFLIHPKKPPAGEMPTPARRCWELWHKGAGYVATLLSVPTISIGITTLAFPDDQPAFQAAYGVSWLIIVSVGLYLFCKDKAAVQAGGAQKGSSTDETEVATRASKDYPSALESKDKV